jgi:PAT family beta-lactamase induction signal transducer AmpG
VLLFVILFKVGDAALGPMATPFWLRDRGFSATQFAFATGLLGTLSAVLGALLGGLLTKRWGTFHALWSLGALQATSNLLYVLAAYLPATKFVLYSVVSCEAFCGGLGTAPFLAFLMASCGHRSPATEYALLSALVAAGTALAGACSGYFVVNVGYVPYFAATFLLALPAFALLPAVRQRLSESPSWPVTSLDLTPPP